MFFMEECMLKKKTKILIALLSILMLFAISIFGGFLGVFIQRKSKQNTMDFSSLVSSANKTVLFIGDGMGENHIKVASAFYEKEMFMTSFEKKGFVSTFSNSLVSPTDSAAAASALATGQKFDNKEVSRHNGIDVETISEIAKKTGIGVGIVTTDSLDGATPSCFSSHANRRGDSDEIIKGQIASQIDLFLGAGKNTYDNYQREIEAKGFVYSSNFSDFSLAQRRVFGSFESVVSKDGTNLAPTLEMLTEFAIDFFETNFPDGYFLMIEGAHIDKKSHSNQIFEMVEYLNSFDQSIKIAHDKLNTQNGVAIIVTADHETGGLQFNNQTKEQISNSLYTRTGHSSKDVPYFIFFKPSKDVDLQTLKSKIDNTDIFKLCKSFISK